MIQALKHLFQPWTWKMAWRDTRTSRRRLVVFSLSVVFGVAALVAIGCFRKSLEAAVDEQSRGLLGADLVIASRQPFSQPEESVFKSISGEQSREVSFSSMIYFPETGGTRLAQIRALGGGFPFYGSMDVTPTNAAAEFRKPGAGALVEDTMLVQYNAHPGSELRVGELKLPVLGSLHKVPGETVVLATIAPRVYISLDDLEKTRLLRAGSLVRYRVYFKFPPGTDVAAVVAKIRPRLDKLHLSYETVEKRKRSLGRSIDNLYNYLNLIGFVALLLGGVGIANAIHVQVRQKLDTVAVLRCLGASSAQTVTIYLLQGLWLGCVGAGVGSVLGVGIERLIPWILRDFLPLQIPGLISWNAVGIGVGVGLLTSVLFTFVPLAAVRNVSPLLAIRQSYEQPVGRWRDPWIWASYGALAGAILLFSLHYTQKQAHGLWFAAALGFGAGILLLLARGIMRMAKWSSKLGMGYVVRQGIANLYRPNNRTALLMLSLGLGTFLILTVYIVQRSLLNQLSAEGYSQEGDTVLFDAQSDQKPQLVDLIRSHGLKVLDEAPIVTMRLSSVKGRKVEALLSDRQSPIPHWALRREYRSTYSGRLRSGEKLLAGVFYTNFTSKTTSAIPVSVEQDIAKDLRVRLGDELTFDLQGVPLKTRVASLREVDWHRVQPNFFIVFPPGSLEGAPAFFALVTRSGSAEKSAELQRSIVQRFPNVSVIDLRLILNTIEALLSKVSVVLQFMALFTAFTGILILIGAVLTGRYQRIRESVLLRTLGASKRQVFSILVVEYFSLGLGAAITGAILAWTASWALAHFVFHSGFAAALLPTLLAFLVVPMLTIIIGMLMSRDAVRRPPMAVLRAEAA